jgi:hypothetical protein
LRQRIPGGHLFVAILLTDGSPFQPILDAEPQTDRPKGEEARTADYFRGLRQIWRGDTIVQEQCTERKTKKRKERSDRVSHFDSVERKDSRRLVVSGCLTHENLRSNFSQNRRRVRSFHFRATTT